MSEIFFRGRRIDNREWIQGYFFQIWDKAYILWGTTNDIPDMTEVDISTVGQWTCKIDKNGKKIFKDDIIKVEYLHNGTSESEIRTVQWDDTNSGYAPLNWNEYCEGCDENTEIVSFEVVGTIHDKEG